MGWRELKRLTVMDNQIAGRGGQEGSGAAPFAGRWGIRWTLRRSLGEAAFAGRGGGEGASLRISV
jgi:hypothetical protein